MKLYVYSICFENSNFKNILETEKEINKIKCDYQGRIKYIKKCFSFEKNNYNDFINNLNKYMKSFYSFFGKKIENEVKNKIIDDILKDEKYINENFKNNLILNKVL